MKELTGSLKCLRISPFLVSLEFSRIFETDISIIPATYSRKYLYTSITVQAFQCSVSSVVRANICMCDDDGDCRLVREGYSERFSTRKSLKC